MDPFTNCARKEAFPDKKTAEAALAAMKRSKEHHGEKVIGNPVVFKCKMGGHWHFGRRNGRRGA